VSTALCGREAHAAVDLSARCVLCSSLKGKSLAELEADQYEMQSKNQSKTGLQFSDYKDAKWNLNFPEFLQGMANVMADERLSGKFHLFSPDCLMSMILDTPVSAIEAKKLKDNFTVSLGNLSLFRCVISVTSCWRADSGEDWDDTGRSRV
jgi:hypothetical protein